ncbi:MAG TPA: hypothetical protein VNK04_23250 [Gemmataceae bacterium]|nr:hypothetical protein [Gemmataceae bacterium]
MPPTLPSWFKYRQGKAEPAGENTCRLTAPNQQDAFISIRPAENGRWSAALRTTADGPDLAATAPEFDNPADAWAAAFELYRREILV